MSFIWCNTLQEELKILRLALALMVEEEVAMKEEVLNQELEKKKSAKVAKWSDL